MDKKIKSVEELNALRDKARAEIAGREGKDIEITVHMSTCGIAAGARDVLTAFMDSIESHSADNVKLKQAGCLGLCDREPMVTLTTKDGQEYLYGNLNARKAERIVREHVLAGEPIVELLVTQAPHKHSES
jgi:NADP-reducing hydrogenase subunit HndB